MKKLLLFDLDGTLLTSDKLITERTALSIRRAEDSGYVFGVCTSRAYTSAMAFLGEFVPRVMIASSGAVIFEDGEAVYTCGFTAEETNHILRVCRDINGDECLSSIDTTDNHYLNFRNTYYLERNLPDHYDPMTSWEDDRCLKICMEVSDDTKASEIISMLPDYDIVRFVGEDWYKITKKDATKEVAILEMCRHMNIYAKDVIAFGDDLIDIGMLKLCGTGIAMSNALPEVKNAADLVIGSNDEDGIAEYLDSILP